MKILVMLMLIVALMAIRTNPPSGITAEEASQLQDEFDRKYPRPPIPPKWPDGDPLFSQPGDRLSIALLGPIEGQIGTAAAAQGKRTSLPFTFQVLIHNEHWVERAFSRYQPSLRVVLLNERGEYVTDVKAYAAALANHKPHYPPCLRW